jgi:hypothetical protein
VIFEGFLKVFYKSLVVGELDIDFGFGKKLIYHKRVFKLGSSHENRRFLESRIA